MRCTGWAGATEHAGNTPHARSFYLAAVERFPQTYFGEQAAERLHEIGSATHQSRRGRFGDSPGAAFAFARRPIAGAATQRWTRAQALQSIAFDSSAELELRAAYADTHAARLLSPSPKPLNERGITARESLPRVKSSPSSRRGASKKFPMRLCIPRIRCHTAT